MHINKAEEKCYEYGADCGGYCWKQVPDENGYTFILFKSALGFEVAPDTNGEGWNTVVYEHWEVPELSGGATGAEGDCVARAELCKMCGKRPTWDGEPGYCGAECRRLANMPRTQV